MLKSVAPEKLDAEVEALAERMAGVPVNQQEEEEGRVGFEPTRT